MDERPPTRGWLTQAMLSEGRLLLLTLSSKEGTQTLARCDAVGTQMANRKWTSRSVGTRQRLTGFAVACILALSVSAMCYSAPAQQITVVYEAGAEQYIVHSRYAAEFEAKTGIKVKILDIPGEEINQKLLMELASGTCAYDVINIDSSLVASFANAGYLEPLDEYITDAERDLFFPLALKSCMWNGKLYQLPTSQEPVLLFYRQDLFAQYGLGRVPQTWDEYIEYARKLTIDTNGDKTPDIWGTVVEGKRTAEPGLHFFHWLTSLGGNVVDKDGNIVINQKPGVAALQFIVDKVHKYKVAPPNATEIWTIDVNNMFAQGKLAMAPQWVYQRFLAEDPQQSRVAGKWGVELFPKNVAYGGSVGGLGISMPARSRNKEAAWKYMQFMVQPKVNKDLYRQGTLPPAYAVLDDPELKKMDPKQLKRPVLEVCADIMRLGTPRPIHPKMNIILDQLMEAVQKALLQQKTPKEAMDELAANLKKML